MRPGWMRHRNTHERGKPTWPASQTAIRVITRKKCRRPCRISKTISVMTSSKVDEPQLKAMFETSAEVLGGLIKAFHDYEQKNESAWRKAS